MYFLFLSIDREGMCFDYKKVYSTNGAMGGGVHLDLIHEMDYALWLFGEPSSIKSTLRSSSRLYIDAIDSANYTLIYDNFVVNIVLNYFRKDTKRNCEIVFTEETWNVDLTKNTIVNFNHNEKKI